MKISFKHLRFIQFDANLGYIYDQIVYRWSRGAMNQFSVPLYTGNRQRLLGYLHPNWTQNLEK